MNDKEKHYKEKYEQEKQKLSAEKEIFKESAHKAKIDAKENLKKEKKVKVILSIGKLLLLILIVVAIPIYIYFFKYDFIAQFKSFEDIVSFLKAYKTESIFIYIGVQVLQIVISIIPGQAFQFAAGYLYTFFPGLIYSWIGATIGTFISFYLAKLLGRSAIHLIFGEERMNYFLERLNSRKSFTIVFLIYLIPGLPKDMVSYAAGLSDMKFKTFLILSLVGRTPGMAGSLLIGSLYLTKHYVAMSIIGGVAVVLFVLCIIYRKKLTKYIDKFYDKIS